MRTKGPRVQVAPRALEPLPNGSGSLLYPAFGRQVSPLEVGMDWMPFLAGLAAPPAYLDPGSGSFLLQLVVAGLLGAALAVRMSWNRIKNIFRRGETPPPDSEKHEE